MTRLDTYLHSLQRFGIHPGLERIRALLSRAGEPQRQYPIVLVGGTNGKGSTCEFLARLLAADNRQTGLYTSPHLYKWNERIRVLDQGTRESTDLFPGMVSDGELDALLDEALPHIDAVAVEHGQPTEFEVLTFLGLWHFARCQVDAAVVEVGLGGTWDATNVTDPTVSVLTRVALDHTDRLGRTKDAIARDKVDIARPHRSFLTTEEDPAILGVLQEECARRGAQLMRVDTSDLAPAEFQAKNARLAEAAQTTLYKERGWSSPIGISASILPSVPGRFEIAERDPLLIFDGANNPDGAQSLADRLRTELGSRPLTLVFGVSADKDWGQMLETLAPLATTLIMTQANHPRALPATTLGEAAQALGYPAEVISSVPDALMRARHMTHSSGAICVTGSFFVLGEVPR